MKLITALCFFCGFASSVVADGASRIPQLARDPLASLVSPTPWSGVKAGKDLDQGVGASDRIPSFFRYGYNVFEVVTPKGANGYETNGSSPFIAADFLLDKPQTNSRAPRGNADLSGLNESSKAKDVSSIHLGAANGGGRKPGFAFRTVMPGGYGPKASPTSGVGLFNR